MIRIVNQSTLFLEKELEQVIHLLPEIYQQMDITVRILDHPRQLFRFAALTKKSTWKKFHQMKKTTGFRGNYSPKTKTITVLTKHEVRAVSNHTKQIVCGFEEQNRAHDEQVSHIVSWVSETTKPQILLALFHEIQHAYQHQCLRKAYDFEADYLDQWQEKDADQFAQSFYNAHRREIKEVLNLPVSYAFVFDRKEGLWQIEMEQDEKETISVKFSY